MQMTVPELASHRMRLESMATAEYVSMPELPASMGEGFVTEPSIPAPPRSARTPIKQTLSMQSAGVTESDFSDFEPEPVHVDTSEESSRCPPASAVCSAHMLGDRKRAKARASLRISSYSAASLEALSCNTDHGELSSPAGMSHPHGRDLGSIAPCCRLQLQCQHTPRNAA